MIDGIALALSLSTLCPHAELRNAQLGLTAPAIVADSVRVVPSGWLIVHRDGSVTTCTCGRR